MAVLNVKMGLPGWAAVVSGIIAGIAIGLLQGIWFAKIHVPSFVVTLAGYLGWQGALLYVLSSTGTINMTDPFIIGIANALLPVALGWALGIAFVVVMAASMFIGRRQRQRAGLEVPPVSALVIRILVIAVIVLAAVAIMNTNCNPVVGGKLIQGVPTAILCFLGFIVVFDLILRRTRFGRYVFAVGGMSKPPGVLELMWTA